MSRRPLDPDSESRRLTIVISEAECAAIDEWRWANRIGSYSEAVRRLIGLGLETSSSNIRHIGSRETCDRSRAALLKAHGTSTPEAQS